MGAELRFPIADIDSSHAAIMAHVTMLVILLFILSGMRGQREHALAGASRISANSGGLKGVP
jgi:hypothetical protein